MTDHSSITSVTEEDDSDESDTTETSNSKASDAVSSIMYSSECNTDDKLTPSLGKISISKKEDVSPNTNKKRRWKSREIRDKSDHNEVVSDTHPFPYGCDPLPLNYSDKKDISQTRKKQRNHSHSFSPFTKYVLHKNVTHQKRFGYLPKQEEENFGVDDPYNYLYTDFSDTSSIPWNDLEDDKIDDEDETSGMESDDQRPFLPDMRSDLWFHAKCFDQYWSHYNFVMEWYRQHIQAVNVLSTQQYSMMNAPHTSMWPQTHKVSQPLPKSKHKSKRARKRARNRRLSRAKQKVVQEKMMEKPSIEEDSESQESEFEMEITEEMMDFFATSFKHRMERDQKEGKNNSDDKDKQIDDEKGGHEFSHLHGPREQPGVRRSAEMKTLYGHGAPMIHGMETAMQMTYDSIVDRRQPKLWPNMPLKIVFA